ncbi:unnamed protein product [Brugia timori]|uniref:Uncharacterized protein n=1 Tax=Brugia timori TaxID=42155 RepID=A0A3P7VTA1_9BILA|nr:unnamed protein product [Brugia timori]
MHSLFESMLQFHSLLSRFLVVLLHSLYQNLAFADEYPSLVHLMSPNVL